MYRILVVDDEENIREVIKEYAEFEGHQVSEACDGMQAIEMVKNNDYDIIIMDVMMPRLDGYSACKEIRKIKQIPVLMLSARGEEYDKLFGFELGIDDYVVKPFAIAELYVKSVALVRRAKGTVIHRELVCGLICCDTSALTVTVDGAAIDMPRKELELLIYLMENRKRVVSRDELLVNIWGYDYDGRTRVVDDHIRKLRKALGKAAGQIKTVITKGYQIRDVQ